MSHIVADKYKVRMASTCFQIFMCVCKFVYFSLLFCYIATESSNEKHAPSTVPLCPTLPETLSNKTELNSTSCGYRNACRGPTILFDPLKFAQFGEFPWMVAVIGIEKVAGQNFTRDIYQCGGSLIHQRVILTSGHCVRKQSSESVIFQWKIRAGEWDTQTEDEIYSYQERIVKTLIVHPEFDSKWLFYDVALLILESPVDIRQNGHIGTICLAPKNLKHDDLRNCFSTAWDKARFGLYGEPHVILKKVEVPIVSKNICENALKNTRLTDKFQLHHSFICSGKQIGVGDICSVGDAGSPLVCPIAGAAGRYQQVGVFSWRVGCSEINISGVYANVAQLKDWIDSIMIKNNLQ